MLFTARELVTSAENLEPAETFLTLTPTSKPSTSNIFDYKYPNSETVSSSDTSLLLNSTDNVGVITDWYKEKIKESGMNVKTFVTTKANDNILNKLVGANGEKKVRIEISKNGEGSTVRISISLVG